MEVKLLERIYIVNLTWLFDIVLDVVVLVRKILRVIEKDNDLFIQFVSGSPKNIF